jgi:peptide/nickel transport system substrate-binding protein
MNRILLFVICVLAGPLSGVATQAKTPDDTLVIARQIDDILSLDPAEAYEFTGMEVVNNVYDRLMRFEAEDTSKLVGGVAESWIVSADGKVFTFKLRPNQTFQSGAPLTAEDAAFSLQRFVILNKPPSFLIGQLGLTKDNVKEMVTAVDPLTLQVKISVDYAPSLVLRLFSSLAGSVVEKKVVLEHEKDGDLGNAWLRTHSAASGPFGLVAWRPNQSITLESFAGYRLGAPGIKRVVIQHVPEPASQRLLLESGDVDIARDLTADQLVNLENNKDIVINRSLGADTWYLALNQSDARLANPKVQQAMKYLVDYDGMANSFLKNRFQVHQTFLPVGFLGAIVDNPYKLDVAKAKVLLAEAGYPNGFEISMVTYNSSPMADIAQSVQQTMAMAGIKIDIVSVEQRQALTRMRARDYQMIAVRWGPDYLDPHTNAHTFAYNRDNSDNAKEKPVAWRASWAVPDEINKLQDLAAQERDTGKREAMYKDLQQRLLKDSPFVIMFQPIFSVAQRSNVKNFVFGLNFDVTYYRRVTK